eukprot:TRINITY_DN3422_c3_g1_i3.p1 TRINITY_DN3422_c3_g1~~TRINITY_DN3422_c3_g1_i3.p1  ORF type:complete len:306 (-),score=87.62 TRINITY_DN3422_c3_g1_i3:85-1002(-)
MDCSIVPSKKYKGFSLISTTDFFYPLVEDPYFQGKIACANVVSDMYALGVVDIDNVLMLLSVSTGMSTSEQDIVTTQLIRGFNDLCEEAETEVTGGQTVKNPWVIVGGVAQSMCKEEDFIRPENAVAGDVLVLTKALGTQLVVNAHQWLITDHPNMEKIASLVPVDAIHAGYEQATDAMMRLNRNGAILMHKYAAHGATDVTGFGILGHAQNLASNQLAKVSFEIHTLPMIAYADVINEQVDFGLMDGTSAETSGGLLIAMSKENAEGFIKELEELDGKAAWIIGDVVEGDNKAYILDEPKVIYG